MDLLEIIKDAELNLLFASGSGFGAVLLAVVCLFAIWRMKNSDGVIKTAFLAWSRKARK